MTGGLAPQAYRGERIGLPESGPGSLAPVGKRIGAFVVDAVLSGLVAALLVRGIPANWSLAVLAIDYVAGTLIAGRTLGMNLLGLRIIRVGDARAVNPWQALVRTALLILFVPAVVWDRDGRGLHDRISDTAVIVS